LTNFSSILNDDQQARLVFKKLSIDFIFHVDFIVNGQYLMPVDISLLI